MKLNLGFSQKVGQPDYGSIGASCDIQFDLDPNLLFEDPEAFRNQVQGIYQACTQSVHDELARHSRNSQRNGGQHAPTGSGNAATYHGRNGNGSGNGNGRGNGADGHDIGNNRVPRQATQAQVKALHAIATRQQLDLTVLLQARFGVDVPTHLSLQQASQLIDELNGSKNPQSNGSGGRQ